MTPILIPPKLVKEAWPLAEPYLKKVSDRGGALETATQWLNEAREGKRQLWFLWSDDEGCRGAGVSSLTETDKGKVCVIDAFAAENGGLWHEALPVFETWARTQGCKRVRVYGRVGFMDQLKGYTLSGVILDRTL